MTNKIDISNFTEDEMLKIANTCSIKEMLRNYKLTAYFCAKFILSTDDYAWGVEDSYYDMNDVLIYQPHLKLKELEDELEKLD